MAATCPAPAAPGPHIRLPAQLFWGSVRIELRSAERIGDAVGYIQARRAPMNYADAGRRAIAQSVPDRSLALAPDAEPQLTDRKALYLLRRTRQLHQKFVGSRALRT
jgi:hypothetical protein